VRARPRARALAPRPAGRAQVFVRRRGRARYVGVAARWAGRQLWPGRALSSGARAVGRARCRASLPDGARAHLSGTRRGVTDARANRARSRLFQGGPETAVTMLRNP
jgi:hypothetical protein